MTKPTLKSTDNRRDWLFPILCLFTVTFFIYRDFDIRMLYGYACLGLVLGVHCLLRLWKDRIPVLDPLRMALLLLAAAVLLNFLRPDSCHDVDTLSFIISMVISCGYVVLSDPGEKRARIALGICFAGAVGITAFVQFFEFNPWYFWNWFLTKMSAAAGTELSHYVPRGYGFALGGLTFTDYVLYIGVAVCCGYAACGRKFDWKSILALIFAGLFLETILIVGRRGELLCAVMCVLLLVLALCGKKQRRILIIGGLITVVVGFAAVVALLPWLKQFQPLVRYVMTVEQLLSGEDISSGRTDLYVLAWNAFLKNPIFGIGWNQFQTQIPLEFQAIHGQGAVKNAHCVYLQFLTETGIVGTPFLLAPLFYCYYLVCSQLMRLKKQAGELQTARMLCVSSFMLQSFLLILSIYDPAFQKIVFWCFYALALMMLTSALKLEGHTPDDPISRFIDKLIHFCAPPFVLVWNWVAGLFRPLRR